MPYTLGIPPAVAKWCARSPVTAKAMSQKRHCTEDLKKINVPVMMMHGDDQQISRFSAALGQAPDGILKTHKDFPHGMPTAEGTTINADLLAFIKGWSF
jgi:hypothetical protein